MSKVKIPNTKFHSNPPGEILVVAARKNRRTDGYDETNNNFSELPKERSEKERKK
jgi:hypothetical protein